MKGAGKEDKKTKVRMRRKWLWHCAVVGIDNFHFHFANERQKGFVYALFFPFLQLFSLSLLQVSSKKSFVITNFRSIRANHFFFYSLRQPYFLQSLQFLYYLQTIDAGEDSKYSLQNFIFCSSKLQ